MTTTFKDLLTESVLQDSVSKKANRALSASKKALKSFGKFKVEMNVLSPLSVEIVVEFQQWLREESIQDAYDKFIYAIKQSDTDGHIEKIEDGNGNGPKFVEALLSGLRPGYKVIAEAFFPTLAYEVTWKNVVTKK